MSLRNLKGKEMVDYIIKSIEEKTLNEDIVVEFIETTKTFTQDEKFEISPSLYSNLNYYLFVGTIGLRLSDIYKIKDRYFILDKVKENYQIMSNPARDDMMSYLSLLENKITEKEPVIVADVMEFLMGIIFKLIQKEEIYTIYPYYAFERSIARNNSLLSVNFYDKIPSIKYLTKINKLLETYGNFTYQKGLQKTDIADHFTGNWSYNNDKDGIIKRFINTIFKELPSGYTIEDLINEFYKAFSFTYFDLISQNRNRPDYNSILGSTIYIFNQFTLLREVALI